MLFSILKTGVVRGAGSIAGFALVMLLSRLMGAAEMECTYCL